MHYFMTYGEVLDAIRQLFSNTDVPVEQTLEDLQGLRDEIDIMIDALENQMEPID